MVRKASHRYKPFLVIVTLASPLVVFLTSPNSDKDFDRRLKNANLALLSGDYRMAESELVKALGESRPPEPILPWF